MALSPAALIALSNVKDVLGVAGTVLVALPFFRLERARREAAKLRRPPTRNPLLREGFRIAEQAAKEDMEQPSPPDFLATLWGLLLIGLSFVVSFVLPYLGP